MKRKLNRRVMSSLALAVAAVLGTVPPQAQALGTRQFVSLDDKAGAGVVLARSGRAAETIAEVGVLLVDAHCCKPAAITRPAATASQRLACCSAWPIAKWWSTSRATSRSSTPH